MLLHRIYYLLCFILIGRSIKPMNNQSIDMMVLKKMGIEKLKETIRESHPPIETEYLGAFGKGTGERVFLPGMTLEFTYTIYTGEDQTDPFKTAVWHKIKSIESCGGYNPQLYLTSSGRHMPATNYLDINTRYWRKIDKSKSDTPCIIIQSRFYEPDLLKKALKELGAPYRECSMM
jgi:glycyl-tRNA synthetase alpha subunit